MFLEFSKTGVKANKFDTNKIGNSLSIRGTNGSNGNRSILFNGVEKINTTMNGLGLVVFNSDLTVASTGVFDIYNNTTARNALVSRMRNLGTSQFAVFATGGTKGIRSTSAIDNEFNRLGSWKWHKTEFLQSNPKVTYAAICHGTHGFVYESVGGSNSVDVPASIDTTFDTIDELGDNGFGVPIYQDDTEYNVNTTLLDKSIDFDTYLTISTFMTNGSSSVVSLQVEFYNNTTLLNTVSLDCDSVYLWQKYNAIIDIPANTDKVVVNTIHTDVDAKITGVQIGKHNGFSPIPSDTLFSTNGIYSERVSQSIHGHDFFDTDWYEDYDSSTNDHKYIQIPNIGSKTTAWKDQLFTYDIEPRYVLVNNTTYILEQQDSKILF